MRPLVAFLAVEALVALPVGGGGAGDAGPGEEVVAGDEGAGAGPTVALRPPPGVPVEPRQTLLAVVAVRVVLAGLEHNISGE